MSLPHHRYRRLPRRYRFPDGESPVTDKLFIGVLAVGIVVWAALYFWLLRTAAH